jgi:AcrR family transcriptional regulator
LEREAKISQLCGKVNKLLKSENYFCFLSFVSTFVFLLEKRMSTIRERIIEEATSLFIRRGCKSLTMDDIANAMGISKRTIYENFADKEDLITQGLFRFFEEGQRGVNAILDSADNVIDVIFTQMQCNSESLMKVKYDFFDEIRRYFPGVYKKTVETFRKESLKNLKKILYKGQRDGVFRKDINVEMCAQLMQELIRLTLLHEAFVQVENKTELMRVFMDTFTRGMSTETGLQLLNKYRKEKNARKKNENEKNNE